MNIGLKKKKQQQNCSKVIVYIVFQGNGTVYLLTYDIPAMPHASLCVTKA
jgi:hypothetical protein